MSRMIALAATFVPALALAACGSNNEPAPIETDPTADLATSVPEAAIAPAMSTDAQGFVDAASASDMYEVEAGKLAQEMGTSQAVKDFGAMMKTDHTKSTADLKAAADQAPGVSVNAALTAKQQSDLNALRSAGDQFDSVYKQQQVAAHEQALAMLRNYAAAGDQAALKDFADKTATVVDGHLGEARRLP